MDKATEFEDVEIAVAAETPIGIDPETPAVDVITAEAVPAAKKRGRPPKKASPPPYKRFED